MAFEFFRPKIKVVTHSGSFHPDDVLACATLALWADKQGQRIEIIRTRDESKFASADIVLDVGMVYDPDKNRFDHHQSGGADRRENLVPYASFGLVWKKFGKEVCGEIEIADLVERELVVAIDAKDNGTNISAPVIAGVSDYGIDKMIGSFNPTWLEEGVAIDPVFHKMVLFGKEVIMRNIAVARAAVLGAKMVREEVAKQGDSPILILEQYVDWDKEVSKHGHIKFVVYRHRNGSDWAIQVGRDNPEDFNSDRASFPKSWQGLRDGELSKVIGIEDAIFCTNGGWYAVARSKDSAIRMAQMALAQS